MKILLADPHPEVQSALHLIIGRIPAVTQVSEASSLIQLLALCVQACPDLILIDPDLVHPKKAAQPENQQPLADLISVLHHLCPCSRIVALSTRFEAEPIALAAGADGFISKADLPDDVLSSIVRFLNYQ